MDTTRIKVKIGPHEFDAEGPTEIVQSQFDAFKSLIDSASVQVSSVARPNTPPTATQVQPNAATDIQLDKICQVDGRVVSLTIKPESDAVAAMLIMLGHKIYRSNDAVTASEIKDGLEKSGYRVDRTDRVMQPLADEGSIIKIGAKKGTRYRFTNPGLAKAQASARDAISQFA